MRQWDITAKITMRKSLLATIMLLITTALSAQQIQVATLSHAGNVTTFYGLSALINAVAAAENGDTINLSPNAFTATDITKGLVIRGAGGNTEEKTYINGNFNITITDSTQMVELEGIFTANTITLAGTPEIIKLIRCNLYEVKLQSISCNDIQLLNDYIQSTIDISTSSKSTISAINSFIGGLSWYSNNYLYALNCVIKDNVSSGNGPYLTFVNSILYYNPATYAYSSRYYYALADHCICISTGTGSSMDGSTTLQSTLMPYSDVFTTFDGNYSEGETFELTGPGAAFLGTDGTPVGIYGGLLPYNPAPSYPLISTMNVGSKSNEDGTLTVQVELSNP